MNIDCIILGEQLIPKHQHLLIMTVIWMNQGLKWSHYSMKLLFLSYESVFLLSYEIIFKTVGNFLISKTYIYQIKCELITPNLI